MPPEKQTKVETHRGVIPQVGDGRNVGSGIQVARHIVFMSDGKPGCTIDDARLSFRPGGIEVVGHDGAVTEGALVVIQPVYFADGDTANEHGVIILISMLFLDDDFVVARPRLLGDFGAGQISFGGDARGGGQGKSR